MSLDNKGERIIGFGAIFFLLKSQLLVVFFVLLFCNPFFELFARSVSQMHIFFRQKCNNANNSEPLFVA